MFVEVGLQFNRNYAIEVFTMYNSAKEVAMDDVILEGMV